MRFVTVEHAGATRWGTVDSEHVRLAPTGGSAPASLLDHLDASGALPDTSGWETVALEDVTLRAPIPAPRRNIMCLGLNYADHAAESQGAGLGGADLPQYPIIFTKATTSVTGPLSDVELDPRVTSKLDWEVELAVVIGRGGRFIGEDAAMEHVFGYTIVNDLSARDLQRHHKQFFLGKSMDGACPMGPWITSADEVPDPHALELSSTVNGETKQASNTRHLIFRIPRIIEQLSTVMTLLPGDIIATGTPSGVGFARNPPEFLRPGDVVECHIEGLASLRNRIVEPRR